MVFAVGLPDDMPNYELEAYIRVLQKNGVNIANTLRVVDPVSGKRWVHAWTNKGEAQKFAAALRQESENEDWRVYPLPNVEPTTGPLGPLEILVSRRSDGCVYSLSQTSRTLIHKSAPEATLAHNVLISMLTEADFEKTQEPLWGHVAFILTGLSEKQIDQLGGYRIIDWREKRVLREAPSFVG